MPVVRVASWARMDTRRFIATFDIYDYLNLSQLSQSFGIFVRRVLRIFQFKSFLENILESYSTSIFLRQIIYQEDE